MGKAYDLNMEPLAAAHEKNEREHVSEVDAIIKGIRIQAFDEDILT